MKTIYTFIFCLLATAGYSQTIYLEAGMTNSRLDWTNIVGDVYKSPVNNFFAGAGIEYLDKRYFNLNSQVSYTKKGGSETVQMTGLNGEDLGTQKSNATFTVVSLSTQVEGKYPLGRMVPFVAAGPRIDFVNSSSYHFSKNEKFLYGGTFSIGLKYTTGRVMTGIKGSYLATFNDVQDGIKEKAAVLSVLIGLRL